MKLKLSYLEIPVTRLDNHPPFKHIDFFHENHDTELLIHYLTSPCPCFCIIISHISPLCVLILTGVGKSSLVLRFVTNNFKPYSESTIGASFMSKQMVVQGISSCADARRLIYLLTAQTHSLIIRTHQSIIISYTSHFYNNYINRNIQHCNSK